ncbi:MAG: DUF503 domain-containing protein [Myxococcota bacterium]|nr:DUF503 domain-containing protein [Myxococcota bacterium]
MVIGVCRLSLYLRENASLKGKRKVVRSIIDRVRSKFNASIAEVGGNDSLKRAVIGVAVVGNEASHVDSMLANIQGFIERLGLAPISDLATEIIPIGEDIGFDSSFPGLDGNADF